MGLRPPDRADRRVAVPMRAAVLASSERETTTFGGESTFPSFSPNSKERVRTRVVLLPQGVRAAGLGRGALRPGSSEWAEAGLGADQVVESRLPNWAQLVLANAGNERQLDNHVIPGPIDVPALVDPATGAVYELDVNTLLAEIAPLRATAVKIWKVEDGWTRFPRTVLGAPRSALHFARNLGTDWKDGISELVTDVRSPAGPPPAEVGERPTDESHAPIEAVGYRTWVTVRAGLVRDAVHPSHVELYATHRGVPPTRWTGIDAAWGARAAADPRVGAWAEHDLRRLSPVGARW